MNTQPAKKQITALYTRLSKDDEQQGESGSISNQKKILEDFARGQGYRKLGHYTDDGWSGTNFQRPGFQAMLADIEAGLVDAVIVKDMSRLGRDYLQVGFYTEILFPQKGVRFIAVNDHVDSQSGSGDSDFAPLRNLFNEWMVRDTSRKIRAVKRAKGMSGKPLTSHPVYGYQMGEDGNFAVDDETAPVVRMIYRLCLKGNGPVKIARILWEQGIPTPGTLEYLRTGNTRRYYPDYPCKWSANTVAHILEYEEYTGVLVNFKTYRQSYKIRKMLYNERKDRAFFAGAHEPIVDREMWERVQELRKYRKRPNRSGEVGLFSGILFCADCGNVMYNQRCDTIERKRDVYICGRYKKRTGQCTAHFTRTDVLNVVVTEEIRRMTEYAVSDPAGFEQLVTEKSRKDAVRREKLLKKLRRDAAARADELDRILKRLYEDNVLGRISDERFALLSDEYETEQAQLKLQMEDFEREETALREESEGVDKFLSQVQKYGPVTQLDPDTLRSLVERIEIHQAELEDGRRLQQIDIYYSFVGCVELPVG